MLMPTIKRSNMSWVAMLLVASILGACGGGDPQQAAQKEVTKAEAKAEKGDVAAQLELAKIYASGLKGVPVDQEKAFGWYKKAAEAGNLEAIKEVAQRLSDGNGVKTDYESMKYWWRKGADQGDALSQYRVAGQYGIVLRSKVLLWDSKDNKADVETFVEWLTKSAAQGYLPAMQSLGMLYVLGVDAPKSDKQLFPRDVMKGVGYLKSAAEKGEWESQWDLAVLYQSGYANVQPNKELSEKYWEMLDKQTDPETQYQIANYYRVRDKQKYVSGKNKYKEKKLDFEESNKIAVEWYKKSAAQNNSNAEYSLYQMYEAGIGTFRDIAVANDYLKEAAEHGNYSAMFDLGAKYLFGSDGMPKDYGLAFTWLLKAANQNETASWSDVHRARNAVGVFYEYGYGVEKDNVIAYAWYNLGASGGYQKSKENLARIERSMKPEQVIEAQALSRSWKPGLELTRENSGGQAKASVGGTSGRLAGSGTGFYITTQGHLLTNNHVVDGCAEVRIPASSSVAKVVVTDSVNDLAILQDGGKNKSYLTFNGSKSPSQGEEVYVFGYPLDGYLPSSGVVSNGILSALAGPGNNSSWIQISAPVQPGNSGGPVLNKVGNVIGVVVAKANALRLAKVTGDIPQNINFAVSERTVKSFLDGNKIPYASSNSYFTISKDSAKIAEIARDSSVKLECYK